MDFLNSISATKKPWESDRWDLHQYYSGFNADPRQPGSVSCYRPVLSGTILDVETGDRPPRFRKLVQPFGSGALGTYGNVCVEVGGWFSAESARLGNGLGGCV